MKPTNFDYAVFTPAELDGFNGCVDLRIEPSVARRSTFETSVKDHSEQH